MNTTTSTTGAQDLGVMSVATSRDLHDVFRDLNDGPMRTSSYNTAAVSPTSGLRAIG